ncbi:MAG TPA: MarR family transcriptional regulator [Clostridia bacterium]|nr:MarR family transcriptional regulator [Clostridia bacterium]
MSKLLTISKLGIVFLTWKRALQKELVPHKITLKQQYVLSQLVKKEYLYPSSIAGMLFCDRPTATVIIKNMERMKWIKREQDAENARKVRIYITKEGKQKLASLKGASGREDMIRYDPLQCLTEEERNLLDTLLDKVLSHLKTDEEIQE